MSAPKRFLAKFIILATMLLGLPLLGVFLDGQPLSRYLEFPPKTRYVQHAPFSAMVFGIYALIILAVIVPLIVRSLQSPEEHHEIISHRRAFPWWGWLGALAGVLTWILAWTRFAWFAEFQAHTFTPLWFALILVINALARQQSGGCLMTDRPGYFLLLFPLSSIFWWFFEYLNRFVQNWYYIGPEFSSHEYFWYATLPFSTVLPAVLSMQQWLFSTRWIQQGCRNFVSFSLSRPRLIAAGIFGLSAMGLAGIGVWPNYFFPLLWVSPLTIIISLQTLMGETTLIDQMATGDWRWAFSSVLAALTCGGFWEMWNFYSLAKWEYSIPFVHRFEIFEMPLLGYAGYLPFGLECAVVGDMLDRMWQR